MKNIDNKDCCSSEDIKKVIEEKDLSFPEAVSDLLGVPVEKCKELGIQMVSNI